MQVFIAKLQSLPETKKKVVLFSIIGASVLIIGFFEIIATKGHIATIQKSLQTINLPAININSNGNNKLQDISKLIGQLQTDRTDSSLGDWKTYNNTENRFSLSYPSSWQIDPERTSATQLRLVSVQGKEQMGMNIELRSQIASAEQGIDAVITNMKEVILPKNNIMVGLHNGYEAIGTLCTEKCTRSTKDEYYPFSVMYITGSQNQIFEIQYGEAIDEIWKKDVKEWKYYDQFKQIISTFNYVK